MSKLEEFVSTLSFEELNELGRLVLREKKVRKPKIIVDTVIINKRSPRPYVRLRETRNAEKCLPGLRRKMNSLYLGYRVRVCNGYQWEVIEEAGDISLMKSIEELNSELH